MGEHALGAGEASFIGLSITSKRVKLGVVFIALILCAVILRAGYLQIYQGNKYFALAEGNRIRVERINSSRGLISDRTGNTLARNVPAFSLWADSEILEGDGYAEVVSMLAELTSVPDVQIHDFLLETDEGLAEVLISQDLSHDAAMSVLASPEAFEGIRVEAGVRREYKTQEVQTLSPILGYTGIISSEEYSELRPIGYGSRDMLGKTGLEKSYESLLRGFPGERRVEVDAYGEAESILAMQSAVDGADLSLHLDFDLQQYIEGKLTEMSGRLGFKNASVIVMDPRDGGIRALVSYPGYDGNIFGSRINTEDYVALIEDPARPLFFRAINGNFPSGSTFKPIVAAGAIDAGVIDENTSFLSSGGLRIGQFFFPDWKSGGHGVSDVRKAIAESVNTFFYIIGGGFHDAEGLGLVRMMQVARDFGLGERLGIDLPGESTGFLPSEEWKWNVKGEPWYIGDTYHVAIGQGDILVTPLQIASMTSTFANGGVLYRPQVVDSYTAQDKFHDVAPHIISEKVASDGAIEIVRSGLREAVLDGSARRLSLLNVSSAGKTGSAQWHSEKPTHAWFTGFAPYEDPELVVTVLVEEGGEGSAVAVPLAHDIFQWWFSR